MATRGCIAVGTMDSWKGVYNHIDSYPSGLGKQLWNILDGVYKKNLHKFAKELIKKKSWIAITDQTIEHPPDDMMTHEEADPLFIEWVYIVDPEKRLLTIMARNIDKSYVGKEPTENIKVEKNGWWNYGHVKCRHDMIIQLDINGKEPDWEALEKMRD